MKSVRFWCYKVLPLVYDDSLSYYELLCKLVNKINEIIENPTGLEIADPVEWSITSQYPYNTLVVDADGTAYVSKQPVPAGVALSNTDYWQPIFKYGDAIDDIKASIATVANADKSIPASLAEGDLAWIGNDLYELTLDLNAGSILIPDTNCTAITVEQWVDAKVGDLVDDIQELQNNITLITEDIEEINGDIENLDTRLDAIEDNEVHSYDAVSDMIADETLKAGVLAITMGCAAYDDGFNGIYKIVEDVPGKPYYTLANGLYAQNITGYAITPQMFGAKGDGVTDDTQAFTDMFNSDKDVVVIPPGSYVISSVIMVGADKHITNYGTFPECKPLWKRDFDLKQSRLFGLAREYTLSSTDSYVEALCYDTKRDKIYIGTRNYSLSTEYMDLIVLNGSTYATESTHTFQIAAVAAMSYNELDDKIYIATTGSGNGKTNALYTIAVSGWSLAGPLSPPNNEQFTMFDSAAKVFVQFYIPVDSNNVYIKVYDRDMATLLNSKKVTLLASDKPQQGFCVYDGHVYTPTANSILEVDYITGDVERLTVEYAGQTNYEEMEDICVTPDAILAVGHRDGEIGGKERLYLYNYDNFKNYDSVTPAVIFKRIEAIPGGSLVIAAGSAASTADFTRPSYTGYSAVTQFVEDATGGGQNNLIYSLKSSQNNVRIYNPTADSVTLTSLYVRVVYVKLNLRASYT